MPSPGQQETLTKYTDMNNQREKLAKDMQVAGQIYDRNPFSPPPYCDPADPTPLETMATMTSQVAPPLALLDSQKCMLYWQIRQATEDIEAATLHLMSWTRVVIAMPVREVFGISSTFLRKVTSRHPEFCIRMGLQNLSDGECATQLEDLVYRAPEVAGALLGAIALYLLPTLYGCLGAAAAVLRDLRRKADLSLLSVTDRGRVQQNVILGVLCGAIIGLFADYIAKATPEAGLGLSALALLAGYNVPGVFAFLDELSNRLFQPSRTGQPDHRT